MRSKRKLKSNVTFFFFLFNFYLFIYLFYCILGFGVHVLNMQDSCIGTHMAVCMAAFLPFTHIWHFSSGYPFPAPPHCPSHILPNRTQCLVLPSLCPCVLIFYHPPMSDNVPCLIFCSCVSLLRMMVLVFLFSSFFFFHPTGYSLLSQKESSTSLSWIISGLPKAL